MHGQGRRATLAFFRSAESSGYQLGVEVFSNLFDLSAVHPEYMAVGVVATPFLVIALPCD